MSFKQLLRKGTLGDPKERPSPVDRIVPADSSPPAAPGRSTRVLYITGDARESRIVSGAFNHSHPHLDFDFSVDLAGARAHLAQHTQCDVLVVGWSVPGEDAFALIGHVRAQRPSFAIVAAAEQSLDLYRQAGADECVRKGGSFLARLPIAIEDALRKRPNRPASPARAFSPGVATLRVAYAGDLQKLHAALEGQRPPLECMPLAQTLTETDLQPGAPAPFDVVLVEHGEKTAAAVADVRARSLEVPLVLLVDLADERAAYDTFGASLDEYIAKTPDWPTRLQLRLSATRTRYQQTRELSALRAKEARLRALVDKLPACIVRVSLEGTIQATNAVALSLLGATSPAQLLKKSFDEMLTAEHREIWADFVPRVCAGETRSIEVSIITLTGAQRVIEATAVPSPDEFARSPSLVMVLRDVSDRKRLEAAVEQATATVSAESQMFEEPTETVVLLHETVPAHEARDAVATPTVIEARPLRDLESDLHRISGTARSTFETLGTILRDAEAQHDAALARQVEEYSRLKTIELEHWRSYETFLNGSKHGVFRVTFAGQLLDVNPSLTATLGYESPADAVAAGASIAFFTDDTTWTPLVQRWREGGLVEPVELPWRCRDRRVITLRLHGRVIDNPAGDGQCLEVIAENVTAQRALAAQLRRARRWEDVARVTSGIAADLSHVVASVNDSTDLDAIQRAASKALALSRQLVAFGRREGRDLVPLDLNRLVSGMETVLRRLVDEHIEIAIELTSELATVEAAQPSVEEALVNLTVAGADVLPAGGRLVIKTTSVEITPETRGDVRIEPGVYGVVLLTATGWGIDTDVRDRLQQVRTTDATTDDVSKGYSSAARAIGHTAGGLRVESVAGESLTFAMYLPQAVRTRAPERSDVAEMPPLGAVIERFGA